MQESILKFLESEKSLLWIKTYDYTEVENAISTGLEKLENKKFFVYEAGKTVNKITGETLATEDLFNTLDELYPQGIRKIPIFLLIKDSLEEILKKSNLDYIKEILDTKKANPKYNFTLIIADTEEVAAQLENMVKFLDKQVIDNEKNIIKYISDLAKFAKVQIDENSIKKIVKDLKESIFKYRGVSSNKKSEMLKVENEIKTESSNSNLKLDNMVYVKGGKYKRTNKNIVGLWNIGNGKYDSLEKKVFDLEVGKYPVTQKLYQEIMGDNPSYFNGKRSEGFLGKDYGEALERPVESVGWWTALDFCNKLSKKYNLEPVYDLSKEKEGILMINQLNGEKSYPDVADFKDTEGFRLPTEVEWEWFASGGEKGNIDNQYAGSSKINEVAWYGLNSNNQTHDVGLKKPNELGIFDCCGNVREWCYDTYSDPFNQKLYKYEAFDSTSQGRVTKGGSFRESWEKKGQYGTCGILDFIQCNAYFNPPVFVLGNWEPENKLCGFRIVRTVNR